MRVLLIGQLPKEMGGNYTTGAANVVYELSKQKEGGVEYYTYGTNIKANAAEKASSYPNQYIGYRIKPLRMLMTALIHPISTYKHLIHYKNVDHQNVLRFFFYEVNLSEVINRTCPDLIHVNSINNVSPVSFAIGNRDIPILLTCHGIFYRGDLNDTEARDCYHGNIPLADAYSGLTQESLDEYEKILGVSRERVAVIPNGVDCKKFFYSTEERNNIRKAFDVADGCKVFITVASVQERKGQFAFIKILERLNVDYQYWIIGKGPDVTLIENYIKDHKIQDRIKLLGYRAADQLFKYYSAADVYAHSSWKEGQALSELEANATGLRTIVNKMVVGTIASDTTSNDYYILDFDNINIEELNRWICSEQTARQSRTTFDWSMIARQYAQLYNHIICNK